MKVLGISCSLRRRGNTEILLEEALAGAREAGAETELLTLNGKDIKPCDGCYTCDKGQGCHIKDDMQLIYDKMLEANGIIWGTPIYFWSMTSLAKNIIDRTLAIRYPHLKLASKVAAVITVGARTGLMSGAMPFYIYFCSNHMLAAEYVCALGDARGGVKQDKYALKAAWEQGRQVAALIAREFRYPEEFNVPLSSLVKKKYGLKSTPWE